MYSEEEIKEALIPRTKSTFATPPIDDFERWQKYAADWLIGDRRYGWKVYSPLKEELSTEEIIERCSAGLARRVHIADDMYWRLKGIEDWDSLLEKMLTIEISEVRQENIADYDEEPEYVPYVEVEYMFQFPEGEIGGGFSPRLSWYRDNWQNEIIDKVIEDVSGEIRGSQYLLERLFEPKTQDNFYDRLGRKQD